MADVNLITRGADNIGPATVYEMLADRFITLATQ